MLPPALVLLLAVPADDSFSAAARVLSQNCVRCHNADNTRGGLDLSSRATTLAGGATDPEAMVPGKPEQSLLLKRALDGSMPPPRDGRRLTDEETKSLAQWIDQGAPWPDDQTLPLRASPSPGARQTGPPSTTDSDRRPSAFRITRLFSRWRHKR